MTYAVATDTASGAAGNETLLHAWHQIGPSGHFGVLVQETAYVVPIAGGLVSYRCAASGENSNVISDQGGSAPCYDFHGDDTIFQDGGWILGDGPWWSAVPPEVWHTSAGVPSIVPVGEFAMAMYGDTSDVRGLGQDIAIASTPNSNLRSVFMAVDVN